MSKLKIWCPSSSKSLGVLTKGVNYDLYETDPPLEGTILCCCTAATNTNSLLARFQKLGLVAKNRTVGSLRGKSFELGTATGFVTYSPGLTLFEPRFATDIQVDVLRANRYARQGSLDAELGEYEYAEDLSDVLVAACFGSLVIAVDLETLGLDEYHEDAYIISVQVSYKKGHAIVVRFDSKEEAKASKVWEQLKNLLNWDKINVRGANLKYDLRWLWVHEGITCNNYSMDTTLVGSLLNENRSNSLETHCWVYAPELGGYDWDLNTKHDKSRMDLVPLKDFLPYAGGDTDAVLRVSEGQIEELSKDPALLNFYLRVLHPTSSSFLRMENTGLLVDQAYMQGFQIAMELEVKTLREKAIPLIPKAVRKKHNEDDLNLTKQGFVRDLFFTKLGWNLKPVEFTEKIKLASTALSHVREVIKTKEQKELFGVIEKYSKTVKALSTYIVGFLSHLKSDGRYHPSYTLHRNAEVGGTRSGRPSCRGPAFQTVPKHTIHAKSIRRGMIAPEGKVLVQVDYSQGELKIVACLANEMNMIRAYLAGIDLHSITGYGLMYASSASQEQHANLMIRLAEQEYAEWKRVRQAGKCISEGELVLTNLGLVPIQNICSWHSVWDGVEWVQHKGLLDHGVKMVYEYDNLRATANHKVFTHDGRSVSFAKAAIQGLRLAKGATGEVPARYVTLDGGYAEGKLLFSCDCKMCGALRGNKDYSREQHISEEVHEMPVCTPQICRPEPQESKIVGGKIRRDASEMQQPHSAKLRKLWRQGDHPGSEERGVYSVHGREVLSGGATRRANRPDRQQQRLLQGESAPCLTKIKSDEQEKLPICEVLGAAGQYGTHMASSENRPPPTSLFPSVLPTCSEQVRLERSNPKGVTRVGVQRVFDILEAGPRNRFTVSGKVVSNSANFGLVFDISPGGFQEYAQNSYGVHLTLEFCEKAHYNFLKVMYPRLPEWHKECRDFAKQHGYIRSPLGRIRHLPQIHSPSSEIRSKAGRQAINSPVQATLSDMNNLAMVEFEKRYPKSPVQFCGTVYDSGLSYQPEDSWEMWTKRIKEIMENLPLYEYFGWRPQLKFTVDVEVGKNLADLKEVEI